MFSLEMIPFYMYPDVVGELFCCSKSHENQLFGDQIQSKFVRLNADFRLVLSSPTTSIPNLPQFDHVIMGAINGGILTTNIRFFVFRTGSQS